jgi:hypothetical protein
LQDEHKRENGQTYRGPATDAIPHIPPISPIYVGRWRRGTLRPTIRMAPEKIPAAPKPATARPRIRPRELGVTPQTREPISKRVKASRNVHFRE